ncbi:methylamine utilization protein [Phenylobacterium sp.]|uniref:methylamine utilization protein n=1 Tax=Phenylobacterium sp. TaxID=1871053 RepID=UPI002D0AF777|nr:methylamine utilization protein [Phenylobacterium sp.]HLZ73950.1 methylamine utilization protein [Phenylobacterium sp.]
MRQLLAILVATLVASPAGAADLALSLATPGGKPLANAVVTVYPASGAPRGPIRFPWPYMMSQKDMQFEPYVLVVPVGAEVAFPNRDPFKHHVFSFSPAKTFELKLYGRDEQRSVKFDKPGVVALGCNIHDDMTAFIKVVDTPFAAKTDAKGEAVVRDLPPGDAQVVVWQPFLKGPRNEVSRSVKAPASGSFALAVTAEARTPPLRRGGY